MILQVILPWELALCSLSRLPQFPIMGCLHCAFLVVLPPVGRHMSPTAFTKACHVMLDMYDYTPAMRSLHLRSLSSVLNPHCSLLKASTGEGPDPVRCSSCRLHLHAGTHTAQAWLSWAEEGKDAKLCPVPVPPHPESSETLHRNVLEEAAGHEMSAVTPQRLGGGG